MQQVSATDKTRSLPMRDCSSCPAALNNKGREFADMPCLLCPPWEPTSETASRGYPQVVRYDDRVGYKIASQTSRSRGLINLLDAILSLSERQQRLLAVRLNNPAASQSELARLSGSYQRQVSRDLRKIAAVLGKFFNGDV